MNSIRKQFKSAPRGSFFASTFLVAITSFFSYVTYFYAKEQNKFLDVLSNLYLSSTGFAVSVLNPVYVGISTAFLVYVYSKLGRKLNLNRFVTALLQMLILAIYIFITLVGSLFVIYLFS
jgi:hypothetical protein